MADQRGDDMDELAFCDVCGDRYDLDKLQNGACEDCRNKAWDIAAAHGIEGIEMMMAA